MSIADDIRAEVKQIINSKWEVREGKKIPDTEDLKLGNDAVTLDAVVLYADLADSTGLVTQRTQAFATEVYKSYLISACRIIKQNQGEITAFDGDRVMAVFFEGNKNTNAAKTALNINWAANMVEEELSAFYSQSTKYFVKQAVGIDSGKLFVARTGIRGSNDLVWVGGSANYAAKLCALRDDYYESWMTERVFKAVLDSAKLGPDDAPMWTEKYWPEYDRTVYASSWSWKP